MTIGTSENFGFNKLEKNNSSGAKSDRDFQPNETEFGKKEKSSERKTAGRRNAKQEKDAISGTVKIIRKWSVVRIFECVQLYDIPTL